MAAYVHHRTWHLAGNGIMLTPHKLGPDGKSQPQTPTCVRVFITGLAADTPARHKIANTLGTAAYLGGCGPFCQYQVRARLPLVAWTLCR